MDSSLVDCKHKLTIMAFSSTIQANVGGGVGYGGVGGVGVGGVSKKT